MEPAASRRSERGRRTATPGRPRGPPCWARRGPASLARKDPGQGRHRRRHPGPMETILSHHADRPVDPGPRAPPGTRVLPPPGPRSPHSDESDWSGGDGTWAPGTAACPSARARALRAQQRPCARSPARRPTWSPPHAERHRATGRWQGEHGGQQAHSYSPAKHNRSVTTTTARTVTDVLTQNCHRSPEASQWEKGTLTLGRYVHVPPRPDAVTPLRPPHAPAPAATHRPAAHDAVGPLPLHITATRPAH